eukprot:scaffold186783_cov35-Tisochrysis_lutea.AAC.1
MYQQLTLRAELRGMHIGAAAAGPGAAGASTDGHDLTRCSGLSQQRLRLAACSGVVMASLSNCLFSSPHGPKGCASRGPLTPVAPPCQAGVLDTSRATPAHAGPPQCPPARPGTQRGKGARVPLRQSAACAGRTARGWKPGRAAAVKQLGRVRRRRRARAAPEAGESGATRRSGRPMYGVMMGREVEVGRGAQWDLQPPRGSHLLILNLGELILCGRA